MWKLTCCICNLHASLFDERVRNRNRSASNTTNEKCELVSVFQNAIPPSRATFLVARLPHPETISSSHKKSAVQMHPMHIAQPNKFGRVLYWRAIAKSTMRNYRAIHPTFRHTRNRFPKLLQRGWTLNKVHSNMTNTLREKVFI